MRQEATKQVIDVAYLAKESKRKGKISWCDHCKKFGHEEKECWHKGFGHLQKDCRTKMEQANMMKEVEETLI